MPETPSNWTGAYADLVDRNIGFITAEQQERLREAKVAVFGLGGIGGTAFEVLVRTGIGRFSIVDRDVFEASNMNRQVFANRHTTGRRKIDVAKECALAINPGAEVEAFDHVDEQNIDDVLRGADAAVLGIDSPGPCIVASRACRQRDVPLVEGWAIPFLNVRVFTKDTPSLEEAYGLGTEGRRVADLSAEELDRIGMAVFEQLADSGIRAFYSEDAVRRLHAGEVVSFGPVVRLTGCAMALEVVKVLLAWGKPPLAPRVAMYDPFAHRVP